MSAFLDTNVLIRHLTGDPPALARRASAFLATADELLLPDLIVAEVVYVLESFYEVERARVAELARAVIGFTAILVVDAPLLLRALALVKSVSKTRVNLESRSRITTPTWSRMPLIVRFRACWATQAGGGSARLSGAVGRRRYAVAQRS